MAIPVAAAARLLGGVSSLKDSSGINININLRSDIDRAVAEFSAFAEKATVAVYRALNRALDKAATETSREIRKVYNVKDRVVKRALSKRRANASSLVAIMRVEGARIALIEFDARQSRNRRPTTVRIKKREGRKIVQGGFIARNTRTGYRGVWKRVGRKRYPIRNLRSVSIPQQFTNRAVLEAVNRMAYEEFTKTYEQQLKFLSGG